MIIIIDFEGVKCMKYSKQREALLTLLRSTRSHPSADWLYENLRKEFPNISLGTVYRNLAQLAENGDILKISTSANKEHFDGFVHRHFHCVCNKCDKTSILSPKNRRLSPFPFIENFVSNSWPE